ncbi:MAG: hypothetical protein ACPL28_05235 [bacterium]
MVPIIILYMMLPIEQIDSTTVTKPDYFVAGVSGVIGGIAGFGITAYVTNLFLTSTNTGGTNFQAEMSYIIGYAIGMPIGASTFIHFNPYNRCPSRKSFLLSLKQSLIGVQVGLCAILIASHISRDTKYWAGCFTLPFPVIGAIKGYHSLPLEIKNENLDKKDSMEKTNNPKLCFKIFDLEWK